MPDQPVRVRVPCYWCKGTAINKTAPWQECDAAKAEGRPVVWDEEPCGAEGCDGGFILATLADPEMAALIEEGKLWRLMNAEEADLERPCHIESGVGRAARSVRVPAPPPPEPRPRPPLARREQPTAKPEDDGA